MLATCWSLLSTLVAWLVASAASAHAPASPDALPRLLLILITHRSKHPRNSFLPASDDVGRDAEGFQGRCDALARLAGYTRWSAQVCSSTEHPRMGQLASLGWLAPLSLALKLPTHGQEACPAPLLTTRLATKRRDRRIRSLPLAHPSPSLLRLKSPPQAATMPQAMATLLRNSRTIRRTTW